MIDINELSKERHKLQKKKELVFKNILHRIYNKIKLANKLNNYCYYMIPKFIVGMPLFDITKCSEYVFNELVKKGFKVTRVQFNHFMIYWGHVDEKTNSSSYNQTNEETIDYSDYVPRNETNFRNINDLTNNSNNFIYDLH